MRRDVSLYAIIPSLQKKKREENKNLHNCLEDNVPQMIIIVMGDIHGCSVTFTARRLCTWDEKGLRQVNLL